MQAFLDILDSVATAALVVDENLKGILSVSCAYSQLKAHGVARVDWLREPAHGDFPDAIVYVCSTDPASVSALARHANEIMKRAPHKELVAAIAPELTASVNLLLQKYGLLGDIRLEQWEAHMAPVPCARCDSLFLPRGGLALDLSVVWATVRALASLQQRSGPFGRVSAYGAHANRVYELVMDQRGETLAETAKTGGFDYHFGSVFVGAQIDHLVLIDRNVDLVTPLCLQLTYLGLIQELYGVSPSGVTSAIGKIQLRHSGLFEAVSELNFAQVGQRLNQIARQLQADFDQRHSAKTVDEIKDFVHKMGDLQAVRSDLKDHTGLAEAVLGRVRSPEFSERLALQQSIVANALSASNALEQIQELIYRGAPLASVLRLLCLLCLVQGGVRDKLLHMAYNDIVRTYGHDKLVHIRELEERGLLFSKARGPTFDQLARSFKLHSEAGPGALYAGYVPLAVRLFESLLGDTPGDQRLVGRVTDTLLTSSDQKNSKLRKVLLRNTQGRERPVVMVMFVGGVTFAEVAALHAAAEGSQKKVDLRVAATGIINGDDLVARG